MLPLFRHLNALLIDRPHEWLSVLFTKGSVGDNSGRTLPTVSDANHDPADSTTKSIRNGGV